MVSLVAVAAGAAKVVIGKEAAATVLAAAQGVVLSARLPGARWIGSPISSSMYPHRSHALKAGEPQEADEGAAFFEDRVLRYRLDLVRTA
ncbi:hypothetical protein [Streptomyces sp. A1-5]|uniref:hypothetical protein n=1 Tax=Streptomyces sp. A1-5 TaxID=2738410 RepID=UPI001F30D7DB|nr:hypothetical protein [Streptomyces sp. A1-5]UJB39480.1 hypothetical protein HRD51_07815 [Streptomyces sp. A1-5]